MTNPLVAERQDSTQAFSGVPILESIDDTKQAIESGDWAAGVMGVVGTGLEALSMAMDPFGSIIAAGVGWLLEHVGPLSDALDALTGDADQIRAHADTWQNIADELGEVRTEMAALVSKDVADWTGEAADAYRKRSEDTGKLVEAAQKAAEGASSGVGTAGEIVAAVRTLVRDIIAELVGRLISWALQVIATLGIGMTWVVPQVVSAVAKTVSKIADVTTKLVKAMKSLGDLVKKLTDGFGDAKKALDAIKKSSGGAPRPKSPAPTRSSGHGGTPRSGPDDAPRGGPASTGSAWADPPAGSSTPRGLSPADQPRSGWSGDLSDPGPSSPGSRPRSGPGVTREVDPPDFGDLNNHNVAGPSTESTITVDGVDYKIVSTPMSKVEGYHGIKPDHYNDVVNGNGVSRPTEGTAGNSDPDWKGWYLAEDKTEAAAFSWNDEGPGAVLKYETPGPVTVHQVPHELTSTLNGPVDPAKMNALKQHFGVGNQPLVDGLAGQNGVIRTQDGEGGMFEYIVPWDTATGGRVTVEGYPNMGNEVKPTPRPGNGLFRDGVARHPSESAGADR